MNGIQNDTNKQLGRPSTINILLRSNVVTGIEQQQQQAAVNTDDDQEEELILSELKRIGELCRSKHSKPSISTVRENLEQLAKKLQTSRINSST